MPAAALYSTLCQSTRCLHSATWSRAPQAAALGQNERMAWIPGSLESPSMIAPLDHPQNHLPNQQEEQLHTMSVCLTSFLEPRCSRATGQIKDKKLRETFPLQDTHTQIPSIDHLRTHSLAWTPEDEACTVPHQVAGFDRHPR